MSGAAWVVPSFEALSFRPRATRHCVVVPVINEGERLYRQLDRMLPVCDQADILIADGGSTDGSAHAGRLEALGVRALLTKTGAGKLSAQMRMAMAWALDQGYLGTVFIDGNDKDDPTAIPKFLGGLDEGFDHLQGSRYLPGGVEENTPWARKWGVRLLHAPLISLAAGVRYTDSTNGFRAYSRQLLLDDRVAPFREVFSQYELHYYLAIRSARLGFRVKEIPVTRSYPLGMRTPTKISPLRGNLLILRTLASACLGRFDP